MFASRMDDQRLYYPYNGIRGMPYGDYGKSQYDQHPLNSRHAVYHAPMQSIRADERLKDVPYTEGSILPCDTDNIGGLRPEVTVAGSSSIPPVLPPHASFSPLSPLSFPGHFESRFNSPLSPPSPDGRTSPSGGQFAAPPLEISDSSTPNYLTSTSSISVNQTASMTRPQMQKRGDDVHLHVESGKRPDSM